MRNSHSDTDSDSNGNADGDSYSNTYPPANPDAYTSAHSDSYADGYAHSDTYADGYAHSHGHTHTAVCAGDGDGRCHGTDVLCDAQRRFRRDQHRHPPGSNHDRHPMRHRRSCLRSLKCQRRPVRLHVGPYPAFGRRCRAASPARLWREVR